MSIHSPTVEGLGDHDYLLRVQQNDDTVVVRVHADPVVVAQIADDEQRVVEATAAYLLARQSADDLPEQVDLDAVADAYDGYIAELQRQLAAPTARTAGVGSISLAAIGREQLAAAREARSGRSAHTVYGGRRHTLRQTVIALTAGSRLDDHDSPGEATLQVLQGRVHLTSAGANWEGRAGDHLVIPAARHGLYAVDDSVVLLTVAKSVERHRHIVYDDELPGL